MGIKEFYHTLFSESKAIDVKFFVTDILNKTAAIFRLLFIWILFLIDGIQSVCWERKEIIGYEFVYNYLGVDIDKMSYLDKLNETLNEEPSDFGFENEEEIYGEDDEEDYE